MVTAAFRLEDSEDLRMLLLHLAYSSPTAWRDDPQAGDLLAFTMDKYGALARKYGLDPADAAVAAFDVMRTRAARLADDPWAVVTRAVQLTLVYDAMAEGLLCSNARARRAEVAEAHDPVRFSDHDTDLAEFHPAFWVSDETDTVTDQVEPTDENEPMNAFMAVETAVDIFVELGWPRRVAAVLLEYIAVRLINTGDRELAFTSLRRDRRARVLLDLDQESWLLLLPAVLGRQDPALQHAAVGRGLLMRLLIGETVEEIVADNALADAIACTVPSGGSHV